MNRDTFSNPMLYETILKLNNRGVPVILFCGYQDSPIPKELKLTTYAPSPKGLILPRRPKTFISYVKIFFSVVLSVKQHKIMHILAIDPYGLIMAGRVQRFCQKLQIHYFSFELFFYNEVQVYPVVTKFKNSEVYYTNKVTSIVIQDSKRKELLIKENNISPKFNNWHLIPVASTQRNITKRRKYLKSDFGLKFSDTVYVHSGSIASWAGIDELITAIEKGLPLGVYLLIHNRFPFDPHDNKYQKLIELKKKGHNIIIHDAFFDSVDDYLDFLSCFDYGIAIYKSDGGIYTGKNIEEIGLASGKFSAYMLAGLPTLLSNCGTYKEIIQHYKVGQIITEKYDLNYHIRMATLKNINKETCNLLYEQVLDPDKRLDCFIDTLK